MSEITLEGDWSPFPELENAIQTALGNATDEVGTEIVSVLKRHFYNQDLGWPALKESTLKQKMRGNVKSLKQSKTRDLRLRAQSHGINTSGMKKGDLVGALSGKTQILIDTGLLAKSFTYKKLSPNSGEVGVMRSDSAGRNIAAIHEYGNPARNLPARPFIKPTAEEMESKLAEIYNKHIKTVTIK